MTSGQGLLWLVTLLLGVHMVTGEYAERTMTSTFLAAQHLPEAAFGSSDVARAVVPGLPAYVLWALFGVGLGAVLRSQVPAVVAAIAIYAGGFAVARGLPCPGGRTCPDPCPFPRQGT